MNCRQKQPDVMSDFLNNSGFIDNPGLVCDVTRSKPPLEVHQAFSAFSASSWTSNWPLPFSSFSPSTPLPPLRSELPPFSCFYATELCSQKRLPRWATPSCSNKHRAFSLFLCDSRTKDPDECESRRFYSAEDADEQTVLFLELFVWFTQSLRALQLSEQTSLFPHNTRSQRGFTVWGCWWRRGAECDFNYLIRPEHKHSCSFRPIVRDWQVN